MNHEYGLRPLVYQSIICFINVSQFPINGVTIHIDISTISINMFMHFVFQKFDQNIFAIGENTSYV